MRFAVESWAPDYGAPSTDETLAPSTVDVDPWVERGPEGWAPIRPAPVGGADLGPVLFIDGVRRVEANVWITSADGSVHQGICASYAAGAVRCDGAARVVEVEARHGLFCAAPDAEAIDTPHARFDLHVAGAGDPGDLSLLLQREMARLEVRVARQACVGAPLAVVDGPLRDGHDDPGLVGYVKTHHTSYGPPVVRDTVAALAVGERTPVLLVAGVRPRFTWYQRLPCDVAHGWAGVVRLEAIATRPVGEVVGLADLLAVALGRFASVPQKDPRAPQNLIPVGGLERELRRRLGDPALLYRSLRLTAAGTRVTR